MKIVSALKNTFLTHANKEKAIAQAAYMKNQFPFLGIQKPVRSKVEKEIFKQHPVTTPAELHEVLTLLWHQEEREYHYSACELAYHYKKLWTPAMLPLFESMIRTKSWWDTVDDIAANLVGLLIVKYPELTVHMDAWIDDEHMWIRRSALLFQLRWKVQTNTERLFLYCSKTMHEKEFFIRKAIGWVLREYSKHNQSAVRDFITTHRSNLSGLSIREGSKYL